VQVLAKSTAYTKRNVQEAVSSWSPPASCPPSRSGTNKSSPCRGTAWAQFLELDGLPVQQDWPKLFAVYRKVLRWFADPAHNELSDSMHSSETRTLAEEMASDLRFAGFRTDPARNDSSYFDSFIQELLGSVPT
jgi:hypothetical protein